MFTKLLGLFSADMGIDLGTANTLVCVKGGEIVLKRQGGKTISRFSPLGHKGGPGYRRAPHYHRRGPGGIKEHRPWQKWRF